jgi:ferredoxin-NADP reductase/ferredoxin
MLKLKSVNFNHQLFQEHILEPSYSGQLEWLIGRDPRCHLVLATLDVSRTHGRIFYSDDQYVFENISQHGSTLNGEELYLEDQKALHKGDLLVLGETYLQVEELTLPSSVRPSLTAAPPRPLPSFEQPWWTEGELYVRCCRIIEETQDVKTFCFVAEPPVLFQYLPGQFVNLEVEIDGKPVTRAYSISSPPSRPYHLALTIKRVASPPDRPDLPPGLVSNWMHDRLKVGDCLKLKSPPMGNFTCVPDVPSKLLLISAGSGVTPIMSMARWMQDTLTDCDIVFLHSARTPEDIIFKGELETMATQLPNFRIAVTITRPSPRFAWAGLTGRVSETMLQLVAPDMRDRAVYVCGPTPWMEDIRAMLEKINFPMQFYKEESFGGYRPAARTPTAPPTLLPAAPPTPMALTAARPAPAPVSEEEPTLIQKEVPTAIQSMPRQIRGVPSERMVMEKEMAAQTATKERSNGSSGAAPSGNSPEIQFAKSNQTVPAEADLSILEIAEQEGVTIPSACRSGACGACKVMTRQGRVWYNSSPTALSAADKEAGYVLACIAQPLERVVVDA